MLKNWWKNKKEIANQSAPLKKLQKKSSKDGDFAVIDFEGFDRWYLHLKVEKLKKYPLQVGTGSFYSRFEEQSYWYEIWRKRYG